MRHIEVGGPQAESAAHCTAVKLAGFFKLGDV
jgi:hypothetical protein